MRAPFPIQSLLSVIIVLIIGVAYPSRASAQHSVAFVEPNSARFQSEVRKAEAPAYPFVAKERHWQGSGVFRLTIDSRSGQVVDVQVRKSTGFKVLDDSSIIALRAWVFKPNHLRQADVPITFQLQPRYSRWPNIPPGAKTIPPSPY